MYGAVEAGGEGVAVGNAALDSERRPRALEADSVRVARQTQSSTSSFVYTVQLLPARRQIRSIRTAGLSCRALKSLARDFIAIGYDVEWIQCLPSWIVNSHSL